MAQFTALLAIASLAALLSGCIILPLGNHSSGEVEREISMGELDDGEVVKETVEEDVDSPEERKLGREIRGLHEELGELELESGSPSSRLSKGWRRRDPSSRISSTASRNRSAISMYSGKRRKQGRVVRNSI